MSVPASMGNAALGMTLCLVQNPYLGRSSVTPHQLLLIFPGQPCPLGGEVRRGGCRTGCAKTVNRDRSVAAGSVLSFGRADWHIEDAEVVARRIEGYLLDQKPKHDAVSLRADEIVQVAESDRRIVAVSQLAEAFSLSVRSIQDICNRAMGVSPKWLIRCFRLQDALERLGAGADMNLAALPRTWLVSIRPFYARPQADRRREPGTLLTPTLRIYTSDANGPTVRSVRG
jgi:AraC-like DNA-binding protein